MDARTSTRELQDRSSATAAPDAQPTLAADELRRMNAYWRAANYLSVGQIYLYDNPLLREPLTMAQVKPLVVGHCGTTPDQNFIYVHLNRVIKKYDLDTFYIAGPGHGGPAIVGSYPRTFATGGRQVPKYAPGARRVIAAHLGGGTSMCAMLDGKSVETTMGFGGLTGLPMATRSGDVPQDLLFYLLRRKLFDDVTLEKMLYDVAAPPPA